MTYEEHQRYIEQTFDSYCKAVIKNTAVDIRRREKTKQKYEISLSNITDSDAIEPYAEDTYSLDEATFSVHGENITVRDPDLSAALSYVPRKYRDVVLRVC